jgi:hypothetical protein
MNKFQDKKENIIDHRILKMVNITSNLVRKTRMTVKIKK